MNSASIAASRITPDLLLSAGTVVPGQEPQLCLRRLQRIASRLQLWFGFVLQGAYAPCQVLTAPALPPSLSCTVETRSPPSEELSTLVHSACQFPTLRSSVIEGWSADLRALVVEVRRIELRFSTRLFQRNYNDLSLLVTASRNSIAREFIFSNLIAQKISSNAVLSAPRVL